MTLSMYQASVPVFVRSFGNLSAILAKAVTWADEQKIDHATLLQARLYPDMNPLPNQIQSASDSAKGAAGRLAGIELPRFEDNETTFHELQARIAKTVAFLQGVDPAQIEGSEQRQVTLKTPTSQIEFTGLDYLLGFALPNFFFHVTTAYGILRSQGVPLGKMDYLNHLTP